MSHWDDLTRILAIFGAEETNDCILLKWDTPDKGQLDLLLKLMSQVSNTPLSGSYSSNEKKWTIL